MPSTRDIYPDTYLKPEHLQGKTVTVTISAVTVDQFYKPLKGRYEPALVVRMKGKKLPFILNKTQCFAIEAIAGDDDYFKWPGVSFSMREGIASNGKRTIVVLAPDALQPPLQEVHPDDGIGGEPHPDDGNGDELHPDDDQPDTEMKSSS